MNTQASKAMKYYYKLVLDRDPFDGSGFGVLLKLEPDPNPMFATRNFNFCFCTNILYYNDGINLLRLLRIAIEDNNDTKTKSS